MTDVAHGTLTTSVQTIVSAVSSTDRRVVTHATFFNTHSSEVTVTVYYMRSGETTVSPGVNKGSKTIPPSQAWLCPNLLGQEISTGGFIQSVATVNSVIDYNITVED